jgi:hypothetical protein
MLKTGRSAPAALIIALSAAGLTITYRSLRHDVEQDASVIPALASSRRVR